VNLFGGWHLLTSRVALIAVCSALGACAGKPDGGEEGSASGSRIVFLSDGKVWSCSPDGFDKRVLAATFEGRPSVVSPSPDGRKIAFLTDLGHRIGGGDLYLMNRDGGALARIAEGGYFSFLDWDPDSTRVYVGGSSTVESVQTDGSERRVLSRVNGMHLLRVSADGMRVLFNRNVEGRMRPVTLAADGGSEKELPLEANAFGMGWSHDGRRVIWGIPDPSGATLRWIDPQSGERGVFDGHGTRFYRHVEMSPTSDRFLAIDQEALYAVELKGGVRTRLTPAPMAPRWDGNPGWLPDGRRVVFENGGRIYLCDADSALLSEVTTGTCPAWMDGGR